MTTPSNPVLDAIHSHASARHYSDQPVDRATLETIVRAAQAASTSSNLQSWSVIAVHDLTTRQQLAELCGGQRHIAEAPLFLAFCADRARLDRVCELRGYTQDTSTLESFLVSALDAVIAAQNAALAAESLGLGICYIGGIRNHPDEICQLLKLPQRVFPVVGMTVGWPSRPLRKRPRLPLSAVLHHERYQPVRDEDLLAYDAAMRETGIYKGRQVPVPGKPDEMEDYGWLEHSARRVSRPERPQLSQSVKKQGFDLK